MCDYVQEQDPEYAKLVDENNEASTELNKTLAQSLQRLREFPDRIDNIFQRELQAHRAQNLFAPAEKSLPVPSSKIHIDEENEGAILNAENGPQQVESLLHYVVDPSTDKGMADALDDADAVKHLNDLKTR